MAGPRPAGTDCIAPVADQCCCRTIGNHGHRPSNGQFAERGKVLARSAVWTRTLVIVFNVGLLEIAVIAVLGLLIFGPEKLPKAVQSLMAGLRSLRGAADDASKSLQGAAGIDGETAKQTMSDLADLHPKRWAAGLLNEDPSDQAAASKPTQALPQAASNVEGSDPDLDPDLP